MRFCALQEVLATKSGVINLMMLVGFVLMLMASKVVSSPYRLLYASMRASSMHMAIGPVLLSTFQVDTGNSQWVGYHFIFGAGTGFGMLPKPGCSHLISP